VGIDPPPRFIQNNLVHQIEPFDKRDAKVPAGYKKVYRQAQPHQGCKEIERRRKQLERQAAKGKP
jgi:hypothetical protein